MIQETQTAMNKVTPQPLVSVLIVNYNSGVYATKAIESLLRQQNVVLDIIVVDNASQDDSLQRLDALKALATPLAKITIIASKENLGFGRANNLAATHAIGQYVLIINPDTELNEVNLIDALINEMQHHPKLGLIAPRIYEPSKKKQVLARYHYPSQASLKHTTTLQRLPGEIAWVLGACMLTTLDIYQKINGFDEDYFLYGEDVDICLRIRQLGYEIGFSQDHSLTHVGGASEIGASSYDKWLRKRRGKCLFIQKHYHPKDINAIANLIIRNTQLYLLIYKLKKIFRKQNTPKQTDHYYRLTATLTVARELLATTQG
jgi:GT2 family glycosyltransferase